MFTLSTSAHPQLVDLLSHFLRTTYKATSSNEYNKVVLDNAVSLLNRDCAYVNIDNSNGNLCDSYPEVLPILLLEGVEIDRVKLTDLLSKCKRARCRNRFVVPVITLGDKAVCRSATLAGTVEIMYRNGWDYLFGTTSQDMTGSSQVVPDRESFDNVRGADIQLLKYFGVTHIIDLMLENRKYKYGVRLTSSEKIDKENRYSCFSLLSLPFPGVEHFSEWVDSGYVESGFRFDWSQDFITADMNIPQEIAEQVNFLANTNDGALNSACDLENDLSRWPGVYQHWDTVKLTTCYFKLLLKLFIHNSSGVLVHCISGWDRTPLFVSLLRLSLWADGAIHKSLNAAEILYLTVAYDWFLFSHNLVDRGKNRQEIFRFCFSMLRHIEDEEFSISSLASGDSLVLSDNNLPTESNSSPRSLRLNQVRTIFENAYATSTLESHSDNSKTNLPSVLTPNALPSSLSRWFINLSKTPTE